MNTPRFDPTITLGSILTMLGMVLPFFVWVVSSNSATDRRLSVLEDNMTSIRSTLNAADARNKESDAELRTGLRRLDDKLGALLIQGYRPAAR